MNDAMCNAPILGMPQDTRPYQMEVDASDFAVGGVLSQLQQDDRWHPIKFHSQGMDPAERNYQIYDKEMLAIMDALAEWRPYLLPLEDAFEIWTDHANLQYYRSPQKLTRRQARWTSKLQEYNYVLKHVLGKTNGKADPLSRRPDYDDGKDDNAGVVVLKDGVICRIQTVDEILDQIRELTKDCSTWDDEIIQDINSSGIWSEIEGEVTNGQTLYVPRNKTLWEEIIDLLHTMPTAGHPGPEKTLEMI
jgi:hypothetical protein